MLYAIFLRRHEVEASIGIHDFEKMARQPLLVSVTLIQNRSERHSSDSILDVLDYDFLRDQIGCLVSERHFELQETLCEELLNVCLSKPNIVGAIVQTEKTQVYADSEGVGCRMARFRGNVDPICAWLVLDA